MYISFSINDIAVKLYNVVWIYECFNSRLYQSLALMTHLLRFSFVLFCKLWIPMPVEAYVTSVTYVCCARAVQ